MSPFEAEIKIHIRANGPMGIDHFMALALGHPRYGYYMTRDPFGLAGDFITAPEISQIFGELLGLFAAISWQNLEEPPRVAFVELGPGRGTLMADMLRAAKAVPGFFSALQVHLVEMSPVLQRAQADKLKESGHKPIWHETIETLPSDCPLIIIANEFFDALPVRQFQRHHGAWRERLVGLTAEETLTLGLAAHTTETLTLDAEEGAVFETSPVSLDHMRRLVERLNQQKGVLLAIDYGHAHFSFGETLQAVRRHKSASVLEHLGENDITAHVDFSSLSLAASRAGGKVWPLLTQATLMERLGIKNRAEILKRKADHPAEIDAAVARLAGDDKNSMGLLFKALAVTSSEDVLPPGFDATDPRLKK